MIYLKPGANIRGLRTEMLFALVVAEGIWGTLVVTEGTGGEHKEGSLHYVGLACDLRSNNLTDGELSSRIEKLRAMLGEDFDIVKELDHVHLEYQPK